MSRRHRPALILPALLPGLLMCVALLAGCGGADEPTATDQAAIDAFDAILRQRTGDEPDAAAAVGALNSRTAKLYGDGQYAEATQIVTRDPGPRAVSLALPPSGRGALGHA